MAVCKGVEVMYQNQMQFNLDVPLAASNIASHYHRPCPIMVERVGGPNTIPGRRQQQQQPSVSTSSTTRPNISASSSFNYTTLSEDTMAKVSMLAKRDLKNKRLQMQRDREKSPSADCVLLNHRQTTKTTCTRQRRPVNKPRSPLRARESEKNRRIGNIQTPPPPRRVRSANLSSVNETQESATDLTEDQKPIENYFPVKTAAVAPPAGNGSSNPPVVTTDEVSKLQRELESYLEMLCRIQQQVLKEGSAEFLQHRVKTKGKNNYLVEEEDLDRVRARAGEINTRSSRNLYNLCQKVKQLQREVSQSDSNKPNRKNQISTQLNATYRGAVRALQTFVNQLPYQDLQMGLPSTYNELALLLRQLTTLMAVTRQGQGTTEEGQDGMLKLLDKVDGLNTKWCSMALQSNRETQTRHRKAWVSDTKVDADLLSKNLPGLIIAKKLAKTTKVASTGSNQKNNRLLAATKQQQQAKNNSKKPKNVAVTFGKENNFQISNEGMKPNVAVKQSLAGQKTFGFVSVDSRPTQETIQPVVKDIDSSIGYILPLDLIAKRERAQRAVEMSNRNFAESTQSSRVKGTTCAVPRPSSAPSPIKKKEVNFDLKDDKRSYLPWIPAGCAPCKPRARSSSGERSPFYVRSLDDTEEWDSVSERPTKSMSMRGLEIEPVFGYRSLPTEQQLRSCDVSDSFVDLIEKRLLYRMLDGKVKSTRRGRMSRKDQMMYSSDEALDITDLTVEDGGGSPDRSSLNSTAEAATMVDAPTLENIRLKLDQMERTKREIRQRWSSLKFADTHHRNTVRLNDCPSSPAAIDFTNKAFTKEKIAYETQSSANHNPINKAWLEEPVVFTKERSSNRPNLHYRHHPHTNTKAQRQQQVVGLCQETLDRILEDRDRLAYQQRKHSHHPAGKFDPWKLMEQISEEILNECFQEVAGEVEKISDEMANQMYKSEFMVTGRPSEAQLFFQEQHQEQEQQEPIISMNNMINAEDHHNNYNELNEYGDKSHQLPASSFSVGGHVVIEGDERLAYLSEDYGTGREEMLMDGDDYEETPRSVEEEEDDALESEKTDDELRSDVPPNGVASEPMLDNVSQLVQEKVESFVEVDESSGGNDDEEESDEDESSEEEDDDDDDGENDDGKDNNDDNEYEDDDDYEEEYSDDNFEKVSDVEL